SQDRMRATTTPSRPSPSGVTSSTSRPIAVSVATSSSRLAPVRTCFRSQFSENFIAGEPRLCESRVPGPESRPSSELAQEAHVVVEEVAQVVDPVTQHREAFDADAEGEAGVPLRIDADVAQHTRVDHAAAEHLEPSGRAVGLLPGDVELGRGLGEREVARAAAHVEVALEERAHELHQGALEVGKARLLLDQPALD